MLLNGYRIQLSLPDCNHFATMPNALIELEEDVAAVLPYLNAVLPQASYDPRVPALSFQYDGRRMVLRPRQVALASVENEADARRVMDAFATLVNQTWDRRSEIEPSYRVPKQIGLLEVYRLLPGGNCRSCGEPTCLAFAGKLAKGQADVAACDPLFAPDHQSNRDRLLSILRG